MKSSEQQEIDSLKLTNNIQGKIIKQRGDTIVEAILYLHKLLPIARRATIASQDELDLINEVQKFLTDEK